MFIHCISDSRKNIRYQANPLRLVSMVVSGLFVFLIGGRILLYFRILFSL